MQGNAGHILKKLLGNHTVPTASRKYLPPAYLDTAYRIVAEAELGAAEQDIQPVVDTVDISGLPI